MRPGLERRHLALAAAVVLLLVPSRRLDLWLVDGLAALRGPPGPSANVTLLVADRLLGDDLELIRRRGAIRIVPAPISLAARAAFEGRLYRRLPPPDPLSQGREDGFWGARYIDFRGTIDSGAFLSYTLEELRRDQVPAGALEGRTVVHGPRATGATELVPTPVGPMTELELAANIVECASHGSPFRLLPVWLQLSILLAGLTAALVAPGRPVHAALALAGALAAVAATAALHVLPGLWACSAGWMLGLLLPAPDRQTRLRELLEAGRLEEVARTALEGEELHAALALVRLGRHAEAIRVLERADLRRFPKEAALELSAALEEQGEDDWALALLEWALVAGGPSPDISGRAAELRSRQQGLRGLLGMEGIQRLISGRYTDLEFLGQGGMGIVLRGHDQFLDRPVAIKVLSPGLLGDPSARGRFRREVETLMRLNHPNIIEIHAVHDDDLLYFSMEYLRGRSAREAIQAGGLDREKLLRVVASCMAHCHEQGILHRDLKSDNVFIEDGGGIKLIDFGIARTMGDSDLTAAGEMIGTLGFLAPELFRGGRPGPRTDLFSFGVMAYELYAGKLPFSHPLTMGVVLPPPGMPPHVGRVALRCMAADPAARYASFEEVAAELEEGGE